MNRNLSLRTMLVAGTAAVALSAGLAERPALAQNPVVSGFQSQNTIYDPWNDSLTIHNRRVDNRASFYDPDRNQADPGSLQYVDRYVYDQQGRLARERGWTWTTNGTPHGSLTRTVVTQSSPYPGSTTVVDEHQMNYGAHRPSYRPGGPPRPAPFVSGTTTIREDHQMNYGAAAARRPVHVHTGGPRR